MSHRPKNRSRLFQKRDTTSLVSRAGDHFRLGISVALLTCMAAKLLLVDDDNTTRNALSRSLRQEGYNVTSVTNGVEAARRLSIESFDLVLSNFPMPGMDGLDLTRHMSRVAPQTPIIIMSESPGINRDDVVTAGAFDLIEKPMDLSSLIAKIEFAFATGAPHHQPGIGFSKDQHFIG